MDVFALNQNIRQFKDFTVRGQSSSAWIGRLFTVLFAAASMECRQMLDNAGLREGGLYLPYKEEVHGIFGRCQ